MMNEKFNVLDHGYVMLVDVMGSDAEIARAARVSYLKQPKEEPTAERDAKLIEYLMKNKHTSPIEQAELKFEIKMPIFVARQWVRHRTASLNEVSGRYSELPEEYYVPEIFAINKQDTKNKQGRGEFMVLEEAIKVRELIDESCKASFEIYKHLLSLGVARELARVVLPLSTYTTIVWKMDLHNLLHFLKLRLDPHAQLEIRAYAKVIEKMVAEFFPATYKAWVAWR